METCTLLVRLAGLWLFGKSWVTLHAIFQTKSMVESMTGNKLLLASNPTLQQFDFNQGYAIIGLIIGLGALAFAGPLARLLTFDAKPSQKSVLD